jgi:hypothetical protein
MSNFKLNLPTDVPWERICVTEDMIDRVVCDARLPAKWQTSLAVFKYRPEDEYQLYPKYNITYLKVTATITGYQPLDKEIQGTINWNGVNVATIPGLTDLLNSYNPCHGAILQVIVGPPSMRPNIPLDEYPFFMDFEPKKRELYELATDTKEKQSRSIESLNITKSGGTTQSLETFDIDMGGGGGGGNVSVFGTGGGFNYAAGNGQWGTKRINAEESMASRSSDVGQEKRETYSFSTQLSQMYHLLDSYHLGTNRAVFFVLPRPHTLEEPSGFVRGPRPVDGIQEFFMVVAQLKDQEDFCVSLRLDTSHLTKIPIMGYKRTPDVSDMASADAPIPTKNDILAERKKWGEACAIFCWDMYYQCYITNAVDDKVYLAPTGFRIEGISDLVNNDSHGSSSVQVSPDGSSVSIHAQASGHICYEDTFGCVDCPDEWEKWSGYARRQVQVNLISTTPTEQIGEEEVLMITTRGLCCCSKDFERKPMDEMMVSVKQIPSYLSPAKFYSDRYSSHYSTARTQNMSGASEAKHSDEEGTCKECGDKSKQMANAPADAKYTIRQVNELTDFIKTETIKSLNDPNVKLQKYVDTDFFAKQLEFKLVQLKKGREILNQSINKDLPKEVVFKLAEYFKRDAKELSRQDLLSLPSEQLARILEMKPDEVQRLKLVSLGIKFNEDNTEAKPKKGKKGDY